MSIVPSGRPDAHLRMSDRDRERVVTRLNEAVAEGRLDIGEFEERLDGVLAAKTFGEVEPFVADLPAVPGPAPDTQPTLITARGSNITRDGRWSVPARMRVEVRGSRVRLDLTQAEIHTPTVYVQVKAHGSNVRLILLPGMSVDFGGLSMHGSRARSRVGDRAHGGGTHIVVTGEMHGSSAVARTPRAWRWPWERRSPLQKAMGR
jgi:hypothetical protein